MQAWKICGLSLLVALFTACEGGGVFVETGCNPACKEGQICSFGQCVIDPSWTVDPPQPPQCTKHEDCNRSAGESCVNGVCKPECDNSNPCAEGACDSGRCVVECDDNDPCTNAACVKGLCKPFVCNPTCTRAEACVSAENENDPAEGKCVEVECNGGADCADPTTQTCVFNPNAANPLEGICRPSCNVSEHDPDPCLLRRIGACVGIESQDPLAPGTCEPVACSNPCNEWVEFCAPGAPANPTVGQCRPVNCAACNEITEACVIDPSATNPTVGQCVAVDCSDSCNATQACVFSPGATNPSVGRCVAVNCDEANGGAGCDTPDEVCVADLTAADPREGVCLLACTVGGDGDDFCDDEVPGSSCEPIDEALEGADGFCA
jgi:hypothetical protein